MATVKIKPNITVDVKISIDLSLAEAQALKEITGYGSKPYLEWYYRNLGKSYMKPHEA